MWKYKLACPFGGFGFFVAVAFYLMLMVSLIFWGMESESGQVWVFRLSPFLIPLITFCFTQWKTPEERRKIREAEPLTWENKGKGWDPFSPDTKWFWSLLIIILALLIGALAAFILKKRGEDSDFCHSLMFFCLIPAGVLAFPFLYSCSYIWFWSHINDTVELARIPVDHSYKCVSPERRQFRPEPTILVCYLPDGKYRFYHDGEGYPPDEVLLIRYKGHIRVWGLEQDFGLR